MFRRAVLLALLLYPLVVAAPDDDPTSRLKVEVLTLSGRPVDRASVIVDFVEGRSYVKLGKKMLKHWEVRTSQEGVAKLPAIPQGKIRVQVIARGYQTFGQMYDLDDHEENITVKLNPPQAQHSEHQ
jgi:hypothetical protein